MQIIIWDEIFSYREIFFSLLLLSRDENLLRASKYPPQAKNFDDFCQLRMA